MDTRSVFLVMHARKLLDGHEDLKLIGVYGSQGRAQEAVERSRQLEGFRDHPDGFSIDGYLIDQDHWTEGFVTL